MPGNSAYTLEKSEFPYGFKRVCEDFSPIDVVSAYDNKTTI